MAALGRQLGECHAHIGFVLGADIHKSDTFCHSAKYVYHLSSSDFADRNLPLARELETQLICDLWSCSYDC